MMAKTKDGKALYLHCLPADINGVSCVDGEVDASVFDRYRVPLYKEASFKPYIIAAMIFLAKCKDPQAMMKKLEARAAERRMMTGDNTPLVYFEKEPFIWERELSLHSAGMPLATV